ncbi:MAG: hypothetical protein ACHREM_19300 [Polyangiales bacterium]
MSIASVVIAASVGVASVLASIGEAVSGGIALRLLTDDDSDVEVSRWRSLSGATCVLCGARFHAPPVVVPVPTPAPRPARPTPDPDDLDDDDRAVADHDRLNVPERVLH